MFSLKIRQYAASVLTCLLFVSVASQVPAADATWTGSGDGTTFSSPANWTAGGPPAGGDVATFDGNSAFTIALPAGTTSNDRFLIDGTAGNDFTFNIGAGNTYELIGTTAANRIGFVGVGKLTVNSGTVNNNIVAPGGDPALNIGRNSTGDGTLILTGANTIWNQNADRAYIADVGTGRLEVRNGARFDSNQPMFIARSGGSGTIIVDGTDSRIDSGSSTNIGLNGTAVLSISNGGRFIAAGTSTLNGNGVVGTSASMFIDGAGSQFGTSFGTFELGANPTSTTVINVTNGGTLGGFAEGVGRLSVRPDINSTASILIDGPGSFMRVTTLFLGGTNSAATVNGGDASLTVSNTAEVDLGGASTIWDAATLTLDNGRVDFSNNNNGDLTNRGTITGNGTLRDINADETLFNFGTITPGLSAVGKINIEANNVTFQQEATGILDMELAGTTPTLYDQIEVFTTSGGSVNPTAIFNGGTVEITPLVGSGILQVGSMFDLVVARTVTINTLPTLVINTVGWAGFLSLGTANTGSLGANEQSLRLTLTVVPEPATATTALLGVILLGLRRDRA